MLQIHINDEICVDGISCQLKKKIAKKDAAWKVLSKLKVSNISEITSFYVTRFDVNKLQLEHHHPCGGSTKHLEPIVSTNLLQITLSKSFNFR